MEIEWLLDCKPRDVQKEAILRSFYGFTSRDNKTQLPRPYQIGDRKGPAKGWGHFLEMRLGKTPTVLNEYLLLQKYHDINKIIVLSPNSYKSAWVKEATHFGIITPFMAYESSQRKAAKEFLDENKDEFGLVVNYEALRSKDTMDLLMSVIGRDVLLVADESIKLKNPRSITSKRAMELSKEVEYVRELTGCPMTQGPHDMFSQLKFIKQLEGGNFWAFRNRFCKMGGWKNKQIVGAKNEEQLNSIINSSGFVAKRKDWANPTNPEYYTVEIPLDKVQAEHYANIDRDFLTMVDNDVEVSVDQVISKMLKLQQVSSGFVYNGEEVIDLIEPQKTPKMLRLKELMEDEIADKVIVAFHYKRSGDALMEALAEYNPAVIRSKDWMKANDLNVDDEKKRFNTDPKCRVMLLNISAGKYGHDLSGIKGDRCTTMVFYENTFSLDDRIQIEMRNTTAFQDWSNVYLDFVASPVEMNSIKALEKKENVVTAILGAYNPDKSRSTRV